MKTKIIAQTGLILLLATLIVFSCKKKENENSSSSTSSSTGGTTGGTTGGGTTGPTTNQVIISGGSTYNMDSIECGGYTATYPTYRQKGTIKGNVNFGLVIDIYGNMAATPGTYAMKQSAVSGEAYVTMSLPNGSGGSIACVATSGSLTSTLVSGSLQSTFSNATFQTLGWPITTYTVSGNIKCN
jgi:hypothetical protein